ncbi:TlpA disulfide reductase family protein [Mucilaginibacter sp.]|uniref:TlpA disulfide reductase family protein n=1 Tax=Mucilaginibacter sp. TaxID=1882438 RepID=UPI002ED18EB2
MKKILLLMLGLMPLVLMAQNNFTVNGNVKKLKNGDKIFLFYQLDDQQKSDSVTVQNSNFSFAGNVPHGVQATICLNKNPLVNRTAPGEKLDFLHFYIEPGKISLKAADSLKNITVSGSQINDDAAVFRAQRQPTEDKFTALNKEFASTPDSLKTDAFINKMRSRESQYMGELRVSGLEFAKTHPKSYISLLTLQQAAADTLISEDAAKAYSNLSPQLKNTPLGKTIPLLLASSTNTRIGSQAIDFAQETPEGKTIKLSDFKGKYVLVDFWASWCGPCREENPNVLAAYNKYKGKGFTILGISLDNPGKKDAWVKAIADDKLTWIQVSDLKGWNNVVALQYGVRSIPSNFLIDPAGKIIAKGLRAEGLNSKLAELLDGGGK